MATLAQLYKNRSSPQAEHGLMLIDQISPAKNSKVLDLGCGTGYLSSVLAERVGPEGSVIGVDPDSERILLAQEEYGNVSNLVFLEGSSEDFPDGPYDLVFMVHVIHWIKDKKPLFQKAYQSLVPGGCFAFIAVEDLVPIAHQYFTLVGADPTTFIYLTPCGDYERIASKCGFMVEFGTVEPRKYSFPNVDTFLEWISASTGKQGGYDHRTTDTTALANFKEPYGDKSIEFEMPLTTLILRKPWE